MQVLNKLLIVLGIFFSLASIIFTSIATAGSTNHSKSITNIYMAQADVTHLNLTTVIPKITPLLTILSSALASSNDTDHIFAAMRTLASSPALTPVVHLLQDSNDNNATISSLVQLAPLAFKGDNSEVQALLALLENSNNQNTTLTSLQSLAKSQTASGNSSAQLQSIVFSLLGTSNNLTGTVDALQGLVSLASDQSVTQNLPLLLQIIQNSKNVVEDIGNLTLAAENAGNINVDELKPILARLQSSSDISATLDQLTAILPQSATEKLAPLITVLKDSLNPNNTLQALSGLLNNGALGPDGVAQLTPINELLSSAQDPQLALAAMKNVTFVLLSGGSSAVSGAAGQLQPLVGLLSSSDNQTETLGLLNGLEASNNKQYLTPLFAMLAASTNVTTTLSNLNNVTLIANANPQDLIPLASILAAGFTNGQPNHVTPEQIRAMLPTILAQLGISPAYRLGLFSYCRAELNGTITSCTKNHAVQGFNLTEILFNELENSFFTPYVVALGLRAPDIKQQKKLADKEASYAPAVSAVLAFNLLTVIFSLFLIFLFASLVLKATRVSALATLIVSVLNFLWALLGAALMSGLWGFIKHTTDEGSTTWGVKVTYGAAYWGLVWVSFALALLNMIIAVLAYTGAKKLGQVEETNESVGAPSDEKTVEKMAGQTEVIA